MYSVVGDGAVADDVVVVVFDDGIYPTVGVVYHGAVDNFIMT